MPRTLLYLWAAYWSDASHGLPPAISLQASVPQRQPKNAKNNDLRRTTPQPTHECLQCAYMRGRLLYSRSSSRSFSPVIMSLSAWMHNHTDHTPTAFRARGRPRPWLTIITSPTCSCYDRHIVSRLRCDWSASDNSLRLCIR